MRRGTKQDGATVTIRRAAADDAPVVAAMAAALLRYERRPPSRFTAEGCRAGAFGTLPQFSILLAELDGAVAGYALFYPGYDTESASRGLLVADLFVAEDARRRGIGRALLAAVAQECQLLGGDWLFWLVVEENRPARQFYEGVGARRSELVPMVLEGEAFARLAGEAPR